MRDERPGPEEQLSQPEEAKQLFRLLSENPELQKKPLKQYGREDHFSLAEILDLVGKKPFFIRFNLVEDIPANILKIMKQRGFVSENSDQMAAYFWCAVLPNTDQTSLSFVSLHHMGMGANQDGFIYTISAPHFSLEKAVVSNDRNIAVRKAAAVLWESHPPTAPTYTSTLDIFVIGESSPAPVQKKQTIIGRIRNLASGGKLSPTPVPQQSS